MPEPTQDVPNTPPENEGVHGCHCCKQHGCKYMDEDCPVEHGTMPGIFCEDCDATAKWKQISSDEWVAPLKDRWQGDMHDPRTLRIVRITKDPWQLDLWECSICIEDGVRWGCRWTRAEYVDGCEQAKRACEEML